MRSMSSSMYIMNFDEFWWILQGIQTVMFCNSWVNIYWQLTIVDISLQDKWQTVQSLSIIFIANYSSPVAGEVGCSKKWEQLDWILITSRGFLFFLNIYRNNRKNGEKKNRIKTN